MAKAILTREPISGASPNMECCTKQANHEDWDCGCTFGCGCCDITKRCRVCHNVVDTHTRAKARRKQMLLSASTAAQKTGWLPSQRNELAKAVRNAGLAPSLSMAIEYIAAHGGYEAVAKVLGTEP
jgi:hypothetical protein